MLKVKVNERISWEDYFNHPFFEKEISNNYPIFDFNCKLHNQNIIYYCQNCKLNICEKCLNQHSSHQFIQISKIGLNDEELKFIYRNRKKNSFSITGTLFTMAPEVLKDEKELINSKSDICIELLYSFSLSFNSIF